MLLRGARLMLFLPEMTFDVQLMTKLDSNAIRLIFKSLVTWLVSKPYFFFKKSEWSLRSRSSLVKICFALTKSCFVISEPSFQKPRMKRIFFFPEGKQLWERHVNYPQLYVSSCFCSLSHSMPMKRGAFGTIVVTLPILFTCRLVLCTLREA